MQTVVVERSFDEPVDLRELQQQEDDSAWCLEMYNVTFKLTYVSLDNRRITCIYEAPDREAVFNAQRQAGMPFDRIWSAAVHDTAAVRAMMESAR
jgi:hypothetical protein